MVLRIKDWSDFQHYKTRTAPPWIKFYRRLLDDPEWFALSGDASKMLANCWLLASEYDGALPDIGKIAFRLRMTEDRAIELISQLSHWLEGDASTLLARRKHHACLEEEREREKEEEREKEDSSAGADTISPGKVLKTGEAHRLELPVTGPLAGSVDADFAEWYAAYPRREARGRALLAYRTARKKVPKETLLAAVKQPRPEFSDPKYVPLPASWLNAERWADEIKQKPKYDETYPEEIYRNVL